MFGLLFSAFMTLISVPAIYYAVYEHKDSKQYVWKQKLKEYIKHLYVLVLPYVTSLYKRILTKIGL